MDAKASYLPMAASMMKVMMTMMTVVMVIMIITIMSDSEGDDFTTAMMITKMIKFIVMTDKDTGNEEFF